MSCKNVKRLSVSGRHRRMSAAELSEHENRGSTVQPGANYAAQIISLVRSIVASESDDFLLRKVAVLVSGAVGKGQATKGSDVDIIVLHDPFLDAGLVGNLRPLICNGLLRQGFQPDYLGSGSMVDWHQTYIPKNHFLLCSELFFARHAVGALDIFTEILGAVSEPKTDLQNAATYLVYTALYRARQCSHLYSLSHNIKYAPGGLRDLQFCNWVARRLCKENSCEPAVFLFALHNNGFLTAEEARDAEAAFNFLLWLSNELHLLKRAELDRFALRWLCHMHKDVFCSSFQVWHLYQEHRTRVLNLCDMVRQKAFLSLGSRMGHDWGRLVRKAWDPCLDSKERTKLVTEAMDDSVRIAGLWYSQDSSLLERVYRAEPSWAVKAVLAQNEHCAPDILQEIASTGGDENRDLRIFAARNPRTPVKAIAEIYRRADAYSLEMETIRQVLVKRGMSCKK